MDAPTPPARINPLSALVAAASGILGYLVWYVRLPHYQDLDPDRAYHVGISRLWALHGLPRTLPQVAGLGWDNGFPEKEFLFHALSGGVFALGGQDALRTLVPVLGCLVLALIGVTVSRYTPPLAAAAVTLCGAVMCSFLVERVVVLRPHVLGMAWCVGLALALLWRNRVGAMLCALGFALSYHAFFVPLALMGVAGAVGFHRDRTLLAPSVAALVGLALGTLVNPYFPANVLMGVTHVGVALKGGTGSAADIGLDAVPLRSDEFVVAFLAPQVILGVTLLLLPRLGQRAHPDLELLVLWTAGFLVLTLKNPRAAEYFLPLATVLLGCLWMHLPSSRWGFAACAVVLVAQLPSAVPRWSNPPGPPVEVTQTAQAVAALPLEASGKLVFNCEWHRSPFLLAMRPDVRFVDLLDPTLLLSHWPEGAAARERILTGQEGDPHAVMRGMFGASYALCQSRAAVEAMEADPSFERLWPPRGSAVPEKATYLYALLEPSPVELSGFLVAALPPAPADVMEQLTPAAGTQRTLLTTPTGNNVASRFVALPQPAADGNGGRVSHCAVVQVTPEDVVSHAGATVLGVGGGRGVRVWFNGAPLYRNTVPAALPRRLHTLVPLPRALAAGDVVEAVYCSRPGTYLGVAMSLWTQAQLDAACPTLVSGSTANAAFPLVGVSRSHCLAPYAAASPQ